MLLPVTNRLVMLPT